MPNPAKKKNETETAQRGQLCFDFRKLNSMIKPLNFPITNQKNFFDQAAKYSIFSSIDVRNAFLSISLTERAQKAASIITPFGVFNTLRTPFGLKSSPSAFCRAMSFVVGDLPFVSIYIDDLLIVFISNNCCQKDARKFKRGVRKIGISARNGFRSSFTTRCVPW